MLKAIVCGTGFGARVHVPALRANGFEVVGLVGTNAERLAKKAGDLGIPASFTDLDQAIETTDATLVTVATTPATHAALATTAIAHGCHVLCEKPFTSDAAEAQALLDAAEQAGVVHMLAHEFRWAPDRALFGRAIADGSIGEPRFLVYDQFMPFCADPETRLPKWWFDVGQGGGWLGAGGSHLIDQIRAWFGDFASLSAALLTVSDRANVADDSYSLRFALANGVEGSMQQSAGAWGPYTTTIRCMGSHGSVWIDGGKVFVADKGGTRELPDPDDLALPAPVERQPFELPLFTRLCATLRDRIEGKDTTTPVAVPTFADGVAAMRILDAVRASAAAGGELVRL